MTETVRTVRLYGALRRRFGREFRLAVASPAEAVRALCCMVPGFEAEMMTAHDRGIGFAVFVERRNLGIDELTMGATGDIRIAPILAGSKRSGWIQVLVGVAVIAIATYASAGTLTAQSVAAVYGAGGVAAAAVGFGAAMAIGGIAQLLTPTPKGIGTADSAQNGASYRFNGPVNTTAQGNAVPLLYGEMIVGSAVISAAILAEDQQ